MKTIKTIVGDLRRMGVAATPSRVREHLTSGGFDLSEEETRSAMESLDLI